MTAPSAAAWGVTRSRDRQPSDAYLLTCWQPTLWHHHRAFLKCMILTPVGSLWAHAGVARTWFDYGCGERAWPHRSHRDVTRSVTPGMSAAAAQYGDRVVDEAFVVELPIYRRSALIENSFSDLLIGGTQVPVRLTAADAVLREQYIEAFIKPDAEGIVVANYSHCLCIADILVTIVVKCILRSDGNGVGIVDAEGELPGYEQPVLFLVDGVA
jgi:hypothetical protein